MENASKALIIAGAILLAILIISLGIMIYNQASGVVNKNAMTEVEVSSFNQRFSQYFGKKVRGANVNSLINTVNNNNMSTDDDTKKVKIVTGDAANSAEWGKTGSNYTQNAKTGATYDVDAIEYTNGGLIKTIKVKQ